MHIPVTQRSLNNWPLRLTACFKSSSEDSTTNTGYRVQTVTLIMWMANTSQPAKKKIRTYRHSDQQLKQQMIELINGSKAIRHEQIWSTQSNLSETTDAVLLHAESLQKFRHQNDNNNASETLLKQKSVAIITVPVIRTNINAHNCSLYAS